MQYHHFSSEVNPYILFCGYTNESNCLTFGRSYNQRCVKWYEVEFILRGEGYIVTEGIHLPTEKGCIFFRTPGSVVQGFNPYHSYLIVFDPFYDECKREAYEDKEFLHRQNIQAGPKEDIHKKPIGMPAFPPVLKAHNFIETEALFSNAYHEFIRSSEESQFFSKVSLMRILMLLVQEQKYYLVNGSKTKNEHQKKVLDTKAYIDEHIHLRFTLSLLSNRVRLSPNFLCRIFKEFLGETIFTYIQKNKMFYAKKLLIETKHPVYAIAELCGFENETYFYTAFKKQVGLSPKEFRECYGLGAATGSAF